LVTYVFSGSELKSFSVAPATCLSLGAIVAQRRRAYSEVIDKMETPDNSDENRRSDVQQQPEHGLRYEGEEKYTPSWARGQSDSVEETPETEKYGGGLDFDHEAAREVTGCISNIDRDGTGDEDTLPPETPDWVDDTIARTRADLTPETPPAIRCRDCVDEFARAVYQCAGFPHTSAFYQLLERHELAFAGAFEESDPDLPDVGGDDEVWLRRDGLAVIVVNGIRDSDADRWPMASYVTVKGPSEGVASFVEDLLTLAVQIKRELRAPSLESDANAAQREGKRVPDSARLVSHSLAAEVVSRLPARGGDE
jgi:hypothetical protein